MVHAIRRRASAALILTLWLSVPFGEVHSQTNSDLIAKGKYLTEAGGCRACHTAPGGEAFAGNRAIETPFGAVYSSNITPDKETGIGNLTDDQFYRVLHDGIAANGEYLYPAMPFTSYTKVIRDDALAIKAYLATLKPVHSEKKTNTLPFPFSIREAMGAWRAMFFTPGEFKPDASKSVEVNRGAYLVQVLAHCGECHTPRNALGAKDGAGALQGAPLQGWYAPNISSDLTQGIGGWSESDLLSYFKTGVAPGHGIAVGPMSEVVHDDLRHLTDSDLKAIIAYLKTTPPKRELDARVLGTSAAGGVLYVNNCASCHQLNGEGVSGKVPALANNGAVKAQGPQDVIKVVLGGLPATGTYGPMPSFEAYLDDGQIAAIANYVRTKWGNDAPANADGFLVADLRHDTPLMLSPGSGHTQCPVTLPGRAQTVLDKAKGNTVLNDVTDVNVIPSLEKLVPEIKAAVSDASSADLVNGLTAAYCHLVAQDQSLSTAQKRSRLNIFGQLAYTQVVAGSIAGSPANRASLR